MPNRLIKESFLTSEKINELTDFEFRLWISLIVSADDAGRGDARPAIIKGRAFPLRERVTIKDIDGALHGLAAKGCVSLYTVGGKPYFWFTTWATHQRIRDVKPKYPGPEEADSLRTDVDNSPQIAADCGGLRPESESEYESKYESKENRTAKQSKRARNPFIPPTFAEVEAYAQEIGYKLDTQQFLDYYESNGWMVGKTHMKDWKAAVRNWKRRDDKPQARKPMGRNTPVSREIPANAPDMLAPNLDRPRRLKRKE